MNAHPTASDLGPDLNRPDIQKLIETLAVKVHQAWVQQRTAEGWTWGKAHNVGLKQHPSLVGYDQLPEHEKEMDRRTARTSIQGLLDLGFEILAPKGEQSEEARHWAPFLQRLESTAAIPLAELRGIWSWCNSSPFRCPAGIHLRLGERMLKQGEAILAYDVLSAGLGALAPGSGATEGGEFHLRMTQLLALSLAQCGASERSKGILLNLCERGCTTPETLGLLGRVYKDLAGKAGTPGERAQCLEQSFQSYLAGYEKADAAMRLQDPETAAGDACYCGINAAALQVLRNQITEGQKLAQQVKRISLDRARQQEIAGEKPDYWLAATLAEAELISGNNAAAELAYRAAAGLVQGNWRELCSTRHQARLLTAALGLAPGFVERLFPPIGIAVFAASALKRLASEGTLDAWEQRQKAELKQRLAAAGVVCGYATALSPADLLFIETLLETEREINVVLPCSRRVCRQIFESAPGWAARFDRLLAKVSSVTEDTQPSCLDEGVNRTFSRLRALGAGILRAQRLDAELHVWAGEEARPFAARLHGSAVLSSFEYVACPYETMPEDAWASPIRQGRPAEGSVYGEDYAIRAMIFGDVKGYSKLSDTELLDFARHFMKRVADVLAGHGARILSRRTAGDGLFLVLADLESAATVARQLRDMVAGARWDECGLPPNLGIRISLDAGPVYTFPDPVTQRGEVCGAYVNRAARIEPVTPPNEVYASEAFASLYVAAGGRTFRFDYAGQTQLPKGFGLTPLYCVNHDKI
jgi:class 3 adenylate cyclase